MREVEKELRAKYKALDPDDFITYATEKISHADLGILREELMEKEALERKRTFISTPAHAVAKVRPWVIDWYKEHCFTLFLDGRNAAIQVELVSIGTLNASLVHPREVFRPALMRHAAQLLVLHNHPSGDVEPSPQDIELTNRLQKAGTLLGIEVIDHIIFAKPQARFVSMKDKNLIA